MLTCRLISAPREGERDARTVDEDMRCIYTLSYLEGGIIRTVVSETIFALLVLPALTSSRIALFRRPDATLTPSRPSSSRTA